MGLFDKMFGSGAAESQQQPNADQRFNELKSKYQSVLNAITQEQVQLQNLHVQDDKLFIRGVAPSEDVKNKIWDQIKLVDQNYANDLTADITVDESRAQARGMAAGASAGGGGGQTYTVKPGDTLSKISKQFYGDAHEYMKIFYANQGTLRDPNNIDVGQELHIPDANS